MYLIEYDVLSKHTELSILAVHVVEDAGGLLPVVVVVDGDEGVLGLLNGHHVPQGNVDTSLLTGHLIEIQHNLKEREKSKFVQVKILLKV